MPINPQGAPQGQMPADTWPITRDDKIEMRDLGRKLTAFLQTYFGDRERVHIKIIAGAFNYVMDVQKQKANLIGDDFALSNKFIKNNNLAEQVEEPYEIEPKVTIDQKIEAAKAEFDKLVMEKEGAEAASASPSGDGSTPSPIQPGKQPGKGEGPKNA